VDERERMKTEPAAKGRVVVVGSSNTDMIVHVPRLPEPGETVLDGRFAHAAGGKGANQAVAAARAGAAVRLVACVGDDDLGRSARAGFVQEGIDVEHVVVDASEASGVAFIFVGADGENSIAVASGANLALTPGHVAAARSAFTEASVLLLQLETRLETVEAAARHAHEAGVLVVLDPAPARELPDSLLEQISILTPNATEARHLTGIAVCDAGSAEAAARQLMARGADSVIVTLGSKGAVWTRRDAVMRIEGHDVDAVDTTGAGDVFAGCLAASLAQGTAPADALAFANAAAALSVTREGAQPSAPSRSDVAAVLASPEGRPGRAPIETGGDDR